MAPAPFAPPLPANVTLGTRWIVAPLSNAVLAVRLAETGGTLSLAPGWSVRTVAAAATPLVVNGVVFVLVEGKTAAVLYAYEGTTGKQLWTSANTIASAAAPGSFWSANGQVYVGTSDGTLYAFGFADERH